MSKTQPIQSMTGYATVTQETAAGRVTLELRSVNSRYLDLSFRLNDELRPIEPLLRERILGRLGRGKVECRGAVARRTESQPTLPVNRSLLGALRAAEQAVRQEFPEAAPLSAIDCLRWPGVIEETQLDAAGLWEQVQPLAVQAIDELVASRIREGARLRSDIEARAAAMAAIVARMKERVPQLLADYQQRLVERLQEAAGVALQASAVPLEETLARIRQEVSVHGMRTDVAEELARLEIHIGALGQTVAGGGSVGKRLDFLMQELNREANTLGSKSVGLEVTDAAVELKLLIEQIREQVQNLE